MGRKPVKDKKELITIRIKGSLVTKLKKVENYNLLVEELVEEHFNKEKG